MKQLANAVKITKTCLFEVKQLINNHMGLVPKQLVDQCRLKDKHHARDLHSRCWVFEMYMYVIMCKPCKYIAVTAMHAGYMQGKYINYTSNKMSLK